MSKVSDLSTKRKIPENIGLAVVLGAGGFKSAAHIGMLEALEENNVPIDLLVASGSASIVAAMYAYYKSARVVVDKLTSALEDDFFDIPWFNYIKLFYNSGGLCEGKNFQRMMVHQLPNGDLQDLKIPLILMATDMKTFDEVEFSSGNVIPIVMASCATPPFFSPVPYSDKLYLDGGISSPLPADVAKKHNPKFILASNVLNHDLKYSTKNMLQVTYRSLQIINFNLARFQSTFADMIINMNIDSSKHKHSAIHDMYLIGKSKTQKVMPQILASLEKNGIQRNSEQAKKNKKVLELNTSKRHVPL